MINTHKKSPQLRTFLFNNLQLLITSCGLQMPQ